MLCCESTLIYMLCDATPCVYYIELSVFTPVVIPSSKCDNEFVDAGTSGNVSVNLISLYLPANQSSVLLTNLVSNSTYDIFIASDTGYGLGPVVNVTVRTKMLLFSGLFQS
jgi:hypothetical protein